MVASRAAEWKLGNFFEYRGDRVAYDAVGEGPPIVLVHGTPFSSYVWRRIAPALAEDYRVHVFDLELQISERAKTSPSTLKASCWLDCWSTGSWKAP
jgi:hypothetical protein